jgi:hypothetical protein
MQQKVFNKLKVRKCMARPQKRQYYFVIKHINAQTQNFLCEKELG